MIYELFSDKSYLISMYIIVVVFLLFVGLSLLVFMIVSLLKNSSSNKEERVDERLMLYMQLTDQEVKDDVWMHALDTFLAKYGVLKTDEDITLFSQFYPKLIAHPVAKKRQDLLKRFIADIVKKNETVHGKDFKKKLGI